MPTSCHEMPSVCALMNATNHLFIAQAVVSSEALGTMALGSLALAASLLFRSASEDWLEVHIQIHMTHGYERASPKR